METLVVASTILLGKEMAVQTIANTSNSIISKVTHLSDNYGDECKKIFSILDINFKLDIISYFIKTNESTLQLNDLSNKLVGYINKSILKIETNMHEIEKFIEDTNKGWFKGIYTSNEFIKIVDNLKMNVKILEERFEYLIKLNK